jgi:ferrochelatase
LLFGNTGIPRDHREKIVKNGVLLVNLGTPEEPTPSSVGTYLQEFLSDPRVVDLPRWLWLPLLKLVIIPLRRHRSSEAYRAIWWPEGSPLLVLSQRLASRLEGELAEEAEVVLAMRYGNPSVEQGLAELRNRGVARVIVLPLYPHYSMTTTETVFDAVSDGLRNLDWYPETESVKQYHDHPFWMDAVAASIREYQETAGRPDRLLFSLHGIPERYVRNGDPYQQQCQESVEDVARRLGLANEEWMLTFQSRVGREPWLQPYTDKTLEALPKQGVHHVQVVCPGFAVDCLETLEEIAIQNRDLFVESGGKKLEYVPALNDSPGQVSLMAELVRSRLG